MLQHVATGWPNVRNMLLATMLRYVALNCCDRLAGAYLFEGLTLEMSAFKSLYCGQFTLSTQFYYYYCYYFINTVDKTKLPCHTRHWRSPTVSLETYPLSPRLLPTIFASLAGTHERVRVQNVNNLCCPSSPRVLMMKEHRNDFSSDNCRPFFATPATHSPPTYGQQQSRRNKRPCGVRYCTGATHIPVDHHSPSLQYAYSYFEKGCPRKAYATMWKGIIGNGGSWFLEWGFRRFSNREKQHKQM